MGDDVEPTVTCLGTTVLPKIDQDDDDSPNHMVFCFSPLLIARSDSKKSLSQREDYEAAKTPWPVPSIEALFLPEFKVDYGRANSYYPIREVSSGSFGGRVFESIEKSSGQRFALKIRSKSKIIDENALQQAKEEVEIGRMVGHHIFIIDSPTYWQNRRNLYIASPWALGGDLFGLVTKFGALPEELVRIYVAQIALAIDFLHSAGIIYRDLKPENILLNGDDFSVRLTDFGLARRLKRGSRTFTICGSPVYSAPEIGFNNDGYDHAVDWWSLGVLMHVLLAGFLPKLDCDVKFGSLSDSVSSGINNNSHQFGCDNENSKKNNNDTGTSNDGKNEKGSVNNQKVEEMKINARRSTYSNLAFDLSDEKLSSASRDLIRRLTNTDPSQRPRSILALSRLAFFVGCDLSKPESANRVSPRLFVDRLVTKKDNYLEMISTDVVFFETEEELLPILV